jgi:YfiH family protein
MKHHFFGKECIVDRSLNNLDNFQKAIKELGFKFKFKPLFLNQIHSNKVIVIDDLSKTYEDGPLPKADAIVTNIRGLPIAIVTADCVPIIFYDDVAQVSAIAHAGWKGAKSGIIENVVTKMVESGCTIGNIKAEIGPCIRQESYEVSKEFFADFIKDDQGNNGFFIPSNKEGHFMFNLPAHCYLKLEKLGLRNIKDEGIDTYVNDKTLFSYRRSTHKGEVDSGRNISTIILE